ncbi:MAG: hypothetical protein JWP69_2316 [Flaviaesturariibacter sp.]|nr:hypothetical protein [Flaviaesturariibacter sp.]
MKKLLLVAVAAVSASLASNAQINKGTVLLGGSIGASTSEAEQGIFNQKERSFSLSPTVGYTIRTNTVLGIGFSYGHGKSSFSGDNTSSNHFGGHLFLRRYKSLSKSFYLYGEAGLGYRESESEQFHTTTDKSIGEQKNFFINLTPGVAYAVNKRIHLEASINSIASVGYSSGRRYNTSAPGNISKYKNVAFQTNLSSSNPLTLGIRLILGK